MRTLASNADDRYQTVRGLDEDVERVLQGRPVHARKSTIWYRARKLIARNRRLAILSAVATAILLFSYGQQVAARHLAETRLDAVRAVALRLARMPDVIDNESTLDAKKKAVEEATEALRKLTATEANNKALSIDLAEGYERLGDVQSRRGHASLGDPVGALQSYRSCQQLLERAEFVGDTLAEAGNVRPEVTKDGHTRMPTAHELADPTVKIPGLSETRPLSEARPGDVIAQQHGEFGHAGIIVEPGQTASVNTANNNGGMITINDWGFRPVVPVGPFVNGEGPNGESRNDPPPVVRHPVAQ